MLKKAIEIANIGTDCVYREITFFFEMVNVALMRILEIVHTRRI